MNFDSKQPLTLDRVVDTFTLPQNTCFSLCKSDAGPAFRNQSCSPASCRPPGREEWAIRERNHSGVSSRDCTRTLLARSRHFGTNEPSISDSAIWHSLRTTLRMYIDQSRCMPFQLQRIRLKYALISAAVRSGSSRCGKWPTSRNIARIQIGDGLRQSVGPSVRKHRIVFGPADTGRDFNGRQSGGRFFHHRDSTCIRVLVVRKAAAAAHEIRLR